MPDISMCSNGDCPSRESCYRYRAVPNPDWQSYSHFEPDKDGCPWFCAIASGDGIRSMEEIEGKGDSE